jgi:hypothetical protein
MDTSSLSGAFELHVLWLGSSDSDGVWLNLSSVDSRSTPLAYANLLGASWTYRFARWIVLMLS